MRIDSSGNVLVGTTTYSSANEGVLLGAGGIIYATNTSGFAASLNRKTTDGDLLRFEKDGATVGTIGTYFGDLYIASPSSTDAGIGFGGSKISPTTTTGSLRDAAIDLGQSAGRFKDLYLSGGAYLGGTGAANHLDDYEEGTFTPTLSGVNMGGTAGYVKIGRTVTITFDVSVPAGTTADYVIGGLPFNCRDRHGTCNVIYANTATAITGGYVDVNNNSIVLIVDGGTSATNLQQNERIIGACHYFTDS